MPRTAFLALLMVLTAAARAAEPEDAAFVVFLAYETPLNRPREAHTAAFFVRTSAEGRVLESFTISWLPARLKDGPRETISPLPVPEPGTNFTLAETLAEGTRGRRRTTRWGPFQVRPELFARARARYEQLESGRVQYNGLDAATRGPAFAPDGSGAVNCLHAVSDIVGEAPLRTGMRRGNAGTAAVLALFVGADPARWFARYPVVDEWLAAPLGLGGVGHAPGFPSRTEISARPLAGHGDVTPEGWEGVLPSPVSR